MSFRFSLPQSLAGLALALALPMSALAADIPTVVIPTPSAAGPTLERKVLLDADHVQLVQIVLRRDGGLPDHADGIPATVQVLAGTGTLYVGQQQLALKPGAFVALKPDQTHRVTKPATGNLVLLVTKIKTPGGAMPSDHHHH